MNTLNSYIEELEGCLNPRYGGTMYHQYFRNGKTKNIEFIRKMLIPGLNMYPEFQVNKLLPEIYHRIFERFNAPIDFEEFCFEISNGNSYWEEIESD